MNTYIVTIKCHKIKEHDPTNKKTGRCPTSFECTDQTGQHHSMLVKGSDASKIRKSLEKAFHVTRIELSDRIMEVIE